MRRSPIHRPLAESMASAAETLLDALPVEFVYLCLPDPGGRTASLHPLLEDARASEPAPPSTMRIAGSLIAEILGEGGPMLLSRPFRRSCPSLELCVRPDVHSLLLVPLEGEAGVLGTLLVASRSPGAYASHHIEAVRPIARFLARAVEREIEPIA